MSSPISLNLNLDVNDIIRRLTRKEDFADRFLELFKAHGVHHNQIPSFFGHGLTLADMSDTAALLAKLNESLLTDACALFGVRLPWLLGVDEKIYDVHCFSKRPAEYARFLSELGNSTEGPILANLYLSTTKKWEEDSLLVLSQHVGYLGNESIFRVHICAGWIHKYWKSRADIAACIAITLRAGVYMRGHWVKSSVNDIGEGLKLPDALSSLNLDKKQYKNSSYENWHPDRWVFDSKNFVDGVSEGKFGEANALARWLEHEQKGLMDADYSCGSAVKIFENHKLELVEKRIVER